MTTQTTHKRATGKKAVALADRRTKALEMRRDGYTLQEIAATLKTPYSTIQRDISTALADAVQLNALALAKMQNERLEMLWGQAVSTLNGNVHVRLRGIRAALDVLDQQARLNRLYAPSETESETERNNRPVTLNLAAVGIRGELLTQLTEFNNGL